MLLHHALEITDLREDLIPGGGVDVEIGEAAVHHIALSRETDEQIRPFPSRNLSLEPVGRNLGFRVLGFANELHTNVGLRILIYHMSILQKKYFVLLSFPKGVSRGMLNKDTNIIPNC